MDSYGAWIITCMLCICHVQGQTQDTDPLASMQASVTSYLQGKKLQVITSLVSPYVFKQNASGSVGYDGFVPDVMEKLGELLEFEWEFSEVVPDHSISEILQPLIQWQSTGGSSGAELAAAAVPVTRETGTEVDLLMPVQHVKFVMVTKRHEETAGPLDYLLVLRPFTTSAWIIVLLMPFVVAFTIWGITKCTGRVCDMQGQEKFNLTGSLWFTLTTMHWQGFDRVPGPVGARVLAYTWFGFCSFMLLTYISSLASQYNWSAKLQPLRQTPYFQNIDDVIKNPHWEIGVVDGTPSHTYMSNYISPPVDQNRLDVVNLQQGVDKVLNMDRYILVVESTGADSLLSEHCRLQRVGDAFGGASYSFALPKNHPLEQALNYGMLKLAETGALELLQNKWFNPQMTCPTGYQGIQFEQPSLKPLDMTTMALPTVVVSVGAVFALLLTGIDILLIKWRGKGLSGELYSIDTKWQQHE